MTARKPFAVGKGDMPEVAVDKAGHIGLVYGCHDSIMFCSSRDGANFTSPALVAVLPRLYAGVMRGPQIASTGTGWLITACSMAGDISSYKQDRLGKWIETRRVNEHPGQSKEGLMALAADGDFAFAVWLEVSHGSGHQVVGARSTDGGLHWTKNKIVYSSPDGSVCGCCKPSLAVRNQQVTVMFRNLLAGNRDMYVTFSNDAGKTFAAPDRLGEKHWKLDGCPMDGGGLTATEHGRIETIWRREADIYAATANSREIKIGVGQHCRVTCVTDIPVYTWVSGGVIEVARKDGAPISLGNGNMPVIKATNKSTVVCVWTNDGTVWTSFVAI